MDVLEWITPQVVWRAWRVQLALVDEVRGGFRCWDIGISGLAVERGDAVAQALSIATRVDPGDWALVEAWLESEEERNPAAFGLSADPQAGVH